MSRYKKPAELYDGLRLHQNENTGGCSPRVIEALAALTSEQLAYYPPYEAATAACAGYFNVHPDRLSLVNGLDEGIMALAVGYLRRSPDAAEPEAIIPQPAFEIFGFDTEIAGGRVLPISPTPDFAFPLDDVLAAITPNTRLVFLTNPNNPTGAKVPKDAICAIARRVPEGAAVFLDEAYAEFAAETFIPELDSFPNVIVGRTFSKAFGLAGIRIGAVIGSPEVLEPLRFALPVYSVNIAAVVAVKAAIEDRAFMEGYLKEVQQSKALLYLACDRLGLQYWRSAANFVLIRVGSRVEALVSGAAARGIYVRDRSSEPGCTGCVRVTAGVVRHTERLITVLEEVLCAAQ
jgi:histidinol-phosphate aminotransferase